MEPVAERDGWAHYRYDGPEGQLDFAIRTPDHADYDASDELATHTLRLAITDAKAMARCQALVVRLVELDGRPGAWCWQRVAEILYGSRTDHPERTIPPLKGWMAVLARVAFDLGLAKGAKRRQRRRARPGDPPLPDYELVRLEMPSCSLPPDRCRHRGTVHLSPTLATALRADLASVPADILRLPQAGLTNPEGRRPSRGNFVRFKVAAIWAARDRSPDPARSRERETPVVRLTIGDLLTTYGGVDVASLRRRRMLAAVFDAVTDALTGLRARSGVGISRVPAYTHDPLSAELEIEGCALGTAPAAPHAGADHRSSPGSQPTPRNPAPGPVSSRAPPH